MSVGKKPKVSRGGRARNAKQREDQSPKPLTGFELPGAREADFGPQGRIEEKNARQTRSMKMRAPR